MKHIILLLFTTIFILANESTNKSFYDIYTQNRATGKANLITADFISSAYATYKLSREQTIEQKVLKPRVINFVNYLYQGVVEQKNIANKKEAIAYSAVLSILAKNGNGSVSIPTGYEKTVERINQEIKLIQGAKKRVKSPISHTLVDYRVFRVPPKYKNSINYFYTMKYAQTIPMSKKLSKTIRHTIKGSERLRNLEHYIKKNLEQFVGLEKKSQTLLPSYRSLDYYVFKNSPKPSINDIIKALNPKNRNKVVQKRLLGLYSSYDYDFKIMQTLLSNGHQNAMRGYYTQIQYRNLLYTKKVTTKNPKKEPIRTHATLEPKIEETLNVMIEGALMFSQTIKNNQVDKRIILTLKELRRIAQKKSMKLPLESADIRFLNKLDLILLEAIGIKDKPITVRVTNRLVERLSAPKKVGFGKDKNSSFGGRYRHMEIP